MNSNLIAIVYVLQDTALKECNYIVNTEVFKNT